jgi:hypothetical protein
VNNYDPIQNIFYGYHPLTDTFITYGTSILARSRRYIAGSI